jgi:hypothetical protein
MPIKPSQATSIFKRCQPITSLFIVTMDDAGMWKGPCHKRKSGATLPTGALWVRLNAGERSASTIDRPKLAMRTSGSKRSNLALAGKAIYTLRAGHKHTPCMAIAFSASFQHFHRSSSFKQGSITSVLPPREKRAFLSLTFNCPVLFTALSRTGQPFSITSF